MQIITIRNKNRTDRETNRSFGHTIVTIDIIDAKERKVMAGTLPPVWAIYSNGIKTQTNARSAVGRLPKTTLIVFSPAALSYE